MEFQLIVDFNETFLMEMVSRNQTLVALLDSIESDPIGQLVVAEDCKALP